MMSPVWLLDALAGLMLVVAAVSATRLASARLPTIRVWMAEPTGFRSSPCGSSGADTDVAYVLMCIAMAGMLVASLKTLQLQTWVVIFGLLTVWFACCLVGDIKAGGLPLVVRGHRAAHLLHCAAMVYMVAAVTPSDSMELAGMCGGLAQSPRFTTLALVFGFVLVWHTVWDLLGQPSLRRYSLGVAPLAGAAPAGDTAPKVCAANIAWAHVVQRSPAATTACRVAMGVTMAFMLLMVS